MAKVMVEKDGVKFIVDNGVQLDAFVSEGYSVVKNEPQPSQDDVEVVSDKTVAVVTPKKKRKLYS